MTIDSVYRPEDFLPDGENEFTFQYEHIGDTAIVVRMLVNDVWEDQTFKTVLFGRGLIYKGGEMLLDAPATGKVRMLRKTPIVNPYLATPNTEFDTEMLEFAMDTATMIQQEIEGHACACPEFPDTSGEGLTLPGIGRTDPECDPYACDSMTAAGYDIFWGEEGETEILDNPFRADSVKPSVAVEREVGYTGWLGVGQVQGIGYDPCVTPEAVQLPRLNGASGEGRKDRLQARDGRQFYTFGATVLFNGSFVFDIGPEIFSAVSQFVATYPTSSDNTATVTGVVEIVADTTSTYDWAIRLGQSAAINEFVDFPLPDVNIGDWVFVGAQVTIPAPAVAFDTVDYPGEYSLVGTTTVRAIFGDTSVSHTFNWNLAGDIEAPSTVTEVKYENVNRAQAEMLSEIQGAYITSIALGSASSDLDALELAYRQNQSDYEPPADCRYTGDEI